MYFTKGPFVLLGHHRLPVSCQALDYCSFCHPSHAGWYQYGNWWVTKKRGGNTLKFSWWEQSQRLEFLKLHLWCLVSSGGWSFCSLCLSFACTGTLLQDTWIRELGELSVCAAACPEDVYVQHVFVYSFLFKNQLLLLLFSAVIRK